MCEIWKKAKHKGYDTLHNAIISALNLHIGKTSFDTNKKMKTTNEAIRTLRKERKILRKIFKASCLRGTNDDKRKAKEAYLTCQTKLRDEIEREDKTRNDNKLKELIKAGGINSNNFWQIRKRILRQKPDVYDLINEEGKVIENKQEALDYTANYFENLYQAREGDKEQTHWTDKIEHRVNKLEKMYNNRLIPTKAISERELNQAIKQLSRGKSPGPDNIPNEALIEANNEMRMIILYVFNKIYSEEEIPKSWSEGKIIRIYKGKGKKGKCSNERGITLSSNSGKLFERIINNRIKEVINMTPNQGGGIKGKSTADHLLRIINFIKANKLKKQKPILVFLDVTKAYDKAWNKAIMYALDSSGVKGKDWTITKKLNENLTASIKTQHGYTRQIHIKDSIRQGGILSVLEYANLMDEITKEIRKNPKCNINIGNETTPGCFLWMDDVVLMHTDPRMIQNMLDTTYRIAQRYRIKFGTEKSKVLHIGPPTPLRNKFTLGPQTLEATDTYKYLGITLNTKGDLTDHLKITKGKTLTTTQTIINLASSNQLKDIQMETIWKLYKACTLPMITYGSEAWIMNNQEKKQIQSINNKNLRTILTTPDTTPGIALRTETTLADISQEIDIKQINYLLKQMNRGTNEHISNSIWERKINTVCTHHNIDINHLHTLEKQQQRAELKRRMQTSRTQMLLKDNQNKSKTKNIMLHRDASNIMCQPKYMTTLNRKQCSAIFKYKSRMLNVKGNFPGSSNDTLCTYCREDQGIFSLL